MKKLLDEIIQKQRDKLIKNRINKEVEKSIDEAMKKYPKTFKKVL